MLAYLNASLNKPSDTLDLAFDRIPHRNLSKHALTIPFIKESNLDGYRFASLDPLCIVHNAIHFTTKDDSSECVLAVECIREDLDVLSDGLECREEGGLSFGLEWREC